MLEFRYDDSGSPYLDPGSAKRVLLDLIDQVRRTGHTLPVKAGGNHPFTVLAVLGMAYRAMNEGEGEPMPDPTGTTEVIDTLRQLRERCTDPGCAHLPLPHQLEHIDLAVAMLRRFRAIASPQGIYGPDEFVAQVDTALALLDRLPGSESAGERADALMEASVRANLAMGMATAAIARRPPL